MKKARRWLPRLRIADLGPVDRVVLLSAGLFALVIFLITLRDRSAYHAVDLRQKVLAARAIVAGLDPYEYIWKPGMTDRLLDPLRDHPGPTRTTSTPVVILLYIPLCWLDYATQRSFWWAVEWACLIGTIFVWLRAMPTQRLRVGFVAMASFFIVGNWLWRLHVERGQYYVFLALLLSVGCAHLLRKTEGIATAIVIGLAVAFRPTFGVFPVVLFFAGKRRVALMSLAVAALACAATLPLVGISGWKSYFMVIQLHQSFDFDKFLAAHYWDRFGARYDVPGVAEGFDFRTDTLLHNTTSVSFYDLCGRNQDIASLHFLLAREHFPIVSKIFGAVVTAAGCAGAFVASRRYASMRLPVALAIVTTLWVDFFIAPERFGYFDVLLLLPLAAFTPLVFRHPAFAPWFALAVVAFVFSTSLVGNIVVPGFSDVGFLATWARFCVSMFAFAAILVVALARRPVRRYA